MNSGGMNGRHTTMKKDAAMKKTSLSSISTFQLVKGCVLAIIFLIAALAAFMLLREDTGLSTTAQQWVYPIGMAGLLAALITLFLGIATQDPNKPEAARKAWFYPLMAGLLGLVCMSLAYAYLGMWPVGVETAIVDMLPSILPLLQICGDMLLHGGSRCIPSMWAWEAAICPCLPTIWPAPSTCFWCCSPSICCPRLCWSSPC